MPKTDQRGLASFVVVGILVVLIGLISVGFSRLTNRDLNQSIETQKAQAAYYSAESGINDIAKLLNSSQSSQNTTLGYPNLNSCNNQLTTNLNNQAPSKTSYGCVLLNSTPGSLSRTSADPNQSWVTRISPSNPLGSLFISWGTADHSTKAYPTLFQGLPAEQSWFAANNPPIIRLTLYSFPATNCGNVAALTACAGYSSKTMFLFPTSSTSFSGGTNVTANTISYTQALLDGSTQFVKCQTAAGGYTLQSDCGVMINTLPSSSGTAYNYYARITPLYDQANMYLQGKDTSGTNVTFTGGQAIVDVTAKNNDVVKRLQAAVELTDFNNPGISTISDVPEYALQTAGTICKRYSVDTSTTPNTITILSTNASDCNGSGVTTPPRPPVAVTTWRTQTPTTVIVHGTVRPNALSANYYFNFGTYSPVLGTWISYGQYPTLPGASLAFNGNGPNYTYNVLKSITYTLQVGVSYGYQLCAKNPTFPVQCGSIVVFTIPKPPPPPPPPPSSSGGGGTGGCAIDNIGLSVDDGNSWQATANGHCSAAAYTDMLWDYTYGSNSGSGLEGNSVSSLECINTTGSATATIIGYDSDGNEIGRAGAGVGLPAGTVNPPC